MILYNIDMDVSNYDVKYTLQRLKNTKYVLYSHITGSTKTMVLAIIKEASEALAALGKVMIEVINVWSRNTTNPLDLSVYTGQQLVVDINALQEY